jgi:phage-related tail fiber protein
MTFATIHTTAGLAAMYNAETAGAEVNLTHMAVGDGNGNPVTPVESQTALVREVYRATVNRVFKPDPVGQPAKFAAELVVPATEGGFVMREVGIFTDDGTLFAVGNLPETYKPEASEGAFSDTVVRLEFLATNVDVITLQLDPNVTVATQAWISNNVTAAALIPGGTTGQILRKVSNADGDTEWADPTDANVIVDVIEEYQALASGQTVVTLATATTTGLAVYIEGVRLRQDATADGWQPDGADPSVLTLGQSYPAGTELIAVQNEPASGFPAALLRDQNLADVPDKPLARQNLGVPSLADLQNAVPSGAVMYFARNTAPAGWLKANGAEVSRTVYSALFNAIGTTFGAGNGSTTFNLPDLRGEFLRGWDDGRGIDASRAFGGAQGGQIQAHGHTGTTSAAGAHSHIVNGGIYGAAISNDRTNDRYYTNSPVTGAFYGNIGTNTAGNHSHTLNVNDTGGNETRPRNVALLACIKF